MKFRLFFLIILNIFFFKLTLAENITYLDFNYIINNTISGKKIISKLNSINDQNLSLLKKEREVINIEKEEIEKTKNLLSNEELNKKIEALNIKLLKFNEKQENLSNEFKNLKQTEIINLVKKINPIIEKFMIENDIDLILKKENIYIGKSENDITLKVVDLINMNIKE